MHLERFGVHFDGRPVQWVTARVRAESTAPDLPMLRVDRRAGVRLDGVVARESLVREEGEVVIIDDDCTVYVAQEWKAETLEDGTIRIFR
jgi:hypothetical protein